MRCLTTSVGTRTSEAAVPAAVAATNCAVSGECPSASTARLSGSYTPMKSADAGITPAMLPARPLYRPPHTMAPPPRTACSRVLIVSMGYSAVSTAAPATAPLAMLAAARGGARVSVATAAALAAAGAAARRTKQVR